MDRLTNEYGYCEKTACNVRTICKCFEKRIYDKLKEYEDMEEQGLLLKLPCKIGQTVWSPLSMSGWYLRKKDAPYQAKIVFIGLNDSEEDGGGFFNVCYEKNTYMMSFCFSDIGKTVFLTKEEAEQALADMEWKVQSMERVTRKHFRPGNSVKLIKEDVLLKMYDKLAEYEDAEEQGLLPRFHLGDEFWTIRLGKVLKSKIVMLQQKKDGSWQYRFSQEITPEYHDTHNYKESEFGKRFFLTKEEAENELAKMKDGV